MIYGILLTAGTSSRMGEPKQLLDWHGQPLVRYIVRQALGSQLDGLIVVTGAAAEATQAALASFDHEESVPVYICYNPQFTDGQATSLQIGLHELPADAEAALVLLVDQPLLTPTLINQVIDAYCTANQKPAAVVPTCEGRRGNPVLLDRALFAELQALEGDVGARDVLQRHAEQVLWLELNDQAVLIDMDTPEAYRHLHG
ncbi:MAG: nucleotidyltransferase family protein [Chloroflexaceae bacterium]|nr:nucleotidyltransferase family protein [Chloroflexaceae bacterium]